MSSESTVGGFTVPTHSRELCGATGPLIRVEVAEYPGFCVTDLAGVTEAVWSFLTQKLADREAMESDMAQIAARNAELRHRLDKRRGDLGRGG